MNFGLPKRQVKERIDYNTGIPVLSVIYPVEGEKNTRILFNSTAVETFNISDVNPIAFNFDGNRVFVASVGNRVADGETFLEVYTNNDYAGIYAYSKKYAEAIRKKFNFPNIVAQMNFTLNRLQIDGVEVYELQPLSEYTEALKIQEAGEQKQGVILDFSAVTENN